MIAEFNFNEDHKKHNFSIDLIKSVSLFPSGIYEIEFNDSVTDIQIFRYKLSYIGVKFYEPVKGHILRIRKNKIIKSIRITEALKSFSQQQ